MKTNPAILVVTALSLSLSYGCSKKKKETDPAPAAVPEVAAVEKDPTAVHAFDDNPAIQSFLDQLGADPELKGLVEQAQTDPAIQEQLEQLASYGEGIPFTNFRGLRGYMTSVQEFPSGPPANSDHRTLAVHAWELFIVAMQGTAATESDGAPREFPVDAFNVTGRAPLYQGGSRPLIFEGLYHRVEAYPYYTPQDTAPPAETSPIGQAPTYRFKPLPGSNTGYTPGTKSYVNLDESNQIGQNMLYYQNSNDPNFPVLYMAKVNRAEVDYARSQSRLPGQDNIYNMPTGTMEIKTAWRRVRDMKDVDPNRFHQAVGTYYTSDGTTVTEHADTFALIAIHIIHKAEFYPQFIFATFEHVDAAVRQDAFGYGPIVDPAYQLDYNHLAYEQGVTSPTAAPFGASDNIRRGGLANIPTTVDLPAAGNVDSAARTTVQQPRTIAANTQFVNGLVGLTMLFTPGTDIWRNYRLKGVQGPPTSNEQTEDFYLANIVVESSRPGVQLFRGTLAGSVRNPDDDVTSLVNPRNQNNVTTTGVTANSTPNINMGGCQGCHGVAQSKYMDFSFLANAAAGHGKSVDVLPAADLSAADATALNKRVMAQKRTELY